MRPDSVDSNIAAWNVLPASDTARLNQSASTHWFSPLYFIPAISRGDDVDSLARVAAETQPGVEGLASQAQLRTL